MKTHPTEGIEVCCANSQETNFKRLRRKATAASTRIKPLTVFAVAMLPIAAGFAQAVPGTAVPDVDGRVASIVSEWEGLPSVFDDIETYTAQIKELVEIGKPAVPALAAALDRATKETPMRLLPFTLRAIGEPRAVPALIRAVPRTLLPPASDCGMSVRDAELPKFKH